MFKLIKLACKHYINFVTSERGTIFLQWTRLQPPVCPLFRGPVSTCNPVTLQQPQVGEWCRKKESYQPYMKFLINSYRINVGTGSIHSRSAPVLASWSTGPGSTQSLALTPGLCTGLRHRSKWGQLPPCEIQFLLLLLAEHSGLRKVCVAPTQIHRPQCPGWDLHVHVG